MTKTINNKSYRGLALRTVVVTMLVLLLAGGAGAQTPISTCGMISSLGEYVLTADQSSSATCITITSSDVVLDGAGHSITGTGVSDTNGVYVFYFSSILTNVTVKNLNVTNWSTGILYQNSENGSIINNTANSNTGNGIWLYSSSNITLNDNNVSNNSYGILLSPYSSNNMLSNNNASSNTVGGIVLSSYSNNNTLSNNTALNSINGIYLASSGNSTLSGNIVSKNNAGIALAISNNNILSGNDASNNHIGIDMGNADNNTLSGNTADSNEAFGIFLGSSSNNTLNNNNVQNNSNGIVLSSSNNNMLSSNNVSNNTIGIYLLYSSADNIIFNNFFNNSNNFITNDYPNTWNIAETPGINIVGGPNLGGNVWAHPNGTGFSNICADGNIDEICDSPYTLDSNNTDYLPLAYSSCFKISSPGEYGLSADPTCIIITSSHVILDGAGHTVTGTGAGVFNTYGVYVHNFSSTLTNITVKNLIVTNWNKGIFYDASNGSIINNTATNSGDGIFLQAFSSNNNISNNNASNSSTGITLIGLNNNNTLSDNKVFNNLGTAIFVFFSSDNILKANNASNNNIGILLWDDSDNNTLIGNIANSNSFSGIVLHKSNKNTLSGNTVDSNNNVGIFLELSSNNTLSGNTVSSNNNIGIKLIPPLPSSNNSIYNNFFNNTNNFEIGFPLFNTWNTTKTSGTNIVGGPNLGGNVWAYPNGTGFSEICADVNNDKICDSPYILDNNNTDYLPLVYNPGTSVQSSTGQGPVYFETDAGTIENLTAVNVSTIPESPPPSANLVYGLFRFNITGLTPGGSANLLLRFPAPLPPGTTYWKYGATHSNATPHWYDITPVIVIGNSLTVTLTDNGTGDDDLTMNGIIRDDSGPSLPIPAGNVTGGGWIVSPITPAPKNNNRATFGFTARFVNGMPAGNLEYTDHVSGMKVKGNVTTLSVNKITMNATFGGTASINGTGAYAYTAKVHDGGEPGRMDKFEITITAISYTASNTLGGGNIQIHDP